MSTSSPEPLDFAALLRKSRSKAGKPFTAALFTRAGCAECLGDIVPGDDVLYYDDELIHEDCNPEVLSDG